MAHAPTLPRCRTPSRWVEPVVDLLFPPRCSLCLADIPRETAASRPICRDAMACPGCIDDLHDGGRRCERCGEVAVDASACRRCRPVPWDWIGVVAGYEGRAREAVLRAKRPTGVVVCRALASVWCDRHGRNAVGRGCDRIVPVPMHWTRRLVRGASAADELAREIAARLRLPVDRRLHRTRSTTMQKDLPPEARPGNVAGAFRFRGRLDRCHVLLVDDVVTTGSTLAACCRAVRAAGAMGVGVAVMVKADRHVGGNEPVGNSTT